MEEILLVDFSTEELGDFKYFHSGEGLDDDEGKELKIAAKLTYEQESKLPDSAFAVVVTVKGKRGTRKIRKYPIEGTPDDETRVRAALRYLGMPRNQKALQKLGISVESVRKKVLARAKELGMTQLLERYRKAEDLTEEEKINADILKNLDAENIVPRKSEVEEALEKKVAELESKIIQLEKENLELKEAKELIDKEAEDIKTNLVKAEDLAKFYLDNAKKAVERRAELQDFAKEVKDEDLVDEKNYEILKLKKENYELRKSDVDNITGKDNENNVDEMAKKVKKAKQY